MNAALPPAALVLGMTVALALGPVALATDPAPSGNGPFLVLAAPWGGGAAARVEAAGGRLIGPTTSRWSALAFGATAEAMRAAGAWAILDPARLGVLCGTKEGR